MARYAIVKDGVVTNVIEADAAFAATYPGAVLASDVIGIGHTHSAGVFTAPTPPAPVIPRSVTRRQAKQALLLGGLLSQVQPAIDAIPDTTQRGLMQIEWDESLEFERHRPSLLAIAAGLGLSSEQLDQLFITAATL